MSTFWCSVVADYKLLNRGRQGAIKRFATAFSNRGFNAILLYRFARACHKKVPLLPTLFSRISQLLYGVDIAPTADLGPGIVLVHCFGIVIGGATRIDGDCVIFHGVTFGDRGSEWVGSDQRDGHPIVSRHCMFGAGAKILGDITIGENCVVGANSVVINSIPDNVVVAGAPARIISVRPRMDEDLRPLGGHRKDTPKRTLEYQDRG